MHLPPTLRAGEQWTQSRVVAPEVICIAHASQKRMLMKFGKTVIMDATHGTNKHGYPLTTLLVLDENRNGFPAAWAIHSKSDAGTLILVLTKLREACPDWKPETFVVDCCEAEISAIERAFPGVR